MSRHTTSAILPKVTTKEATRCCVVYVYVFTANSPRSYASLRRTIQRPSKQTEKPLDVHSTHPLMPFTTASRLMGSDASPTWTGSMTAHTHTYTKRTIAKGRQVSLQRPEDTQQLHHCVERDDGRRRCHYAGKLSHYTCTYTHAPSQRSRRPPKAGALVTRPTSFLALPFIETLGRTL